MRTLRVYLILFLHLLLTSAKGQPYYFFSNYTSDDGLSNHNIQCIVKDRDGFIWIGTESGLNRFNGSSFETYRSLVSDSVTLPSNNLRYLFVDHTGRLWISTFQGICYYDNLKNNFRRVPFMDSKGNRSFSFESLIMFEDSQKNLWAGTNGMGLVQLDKKRMSFLKAIPDSNPRYSAIINGIIEDAGGTLWMTSYHYLFNFNPHNKKIKVFENFLDGNKTQSFQALRLLADKYDNNILWIGTWGSGLVKFDKTKSEFDSYKFLSKGSPNLQNIIQDLSHAGLNKLWLATSEGLLSFDRKKNIFADQISDSIREKPVINTKVNVIYKDDQDILWVGTMLGLCSINPSKQGFVRHPLWVKAPVRRFYYDEKAEKIYGIRYYDTRSLVIYDRKKEHTSEYKIPQADQLSAEPFAITKDINGLIWIGTTKGIYIFDETKESFRLFNIEKQTSLPDRSIFAGYVCNDSNGNIWFSCYGKGMIVIEPASYRVRTFFNDEKDSYKFPFKAIVRIVEGKNKMLYACDENGGIAILNLISGQTEYIRASDKKYEMLAVATDIAVDIKNNMWITTLNSGLICIDSSRNVTVFPRDDFGNLITGQQSILVDHEGIIWLTGDNGLYRFNSGSKSFKHFSTQEGLPAATISERMHLLRDGSIAYGFSKGIYKFYPGQLIESEKPLKVHFTSFYVNGKSALMSNYIDATDTVNLKYYENNLTLGFAAINFTNPHSTLYSYLLEGVDDNWSVPSYEGGVNFSKLSPGDYKLRIRAGLTDFNARSPEKVLVIRIIPSWWQTSWFRWLVITIAVTGIYFILRFFLSIKYKQKIAKLEQQRVIENIRVGISRDIHDEIGSGLTKIKLMSRKLINARELSENLLETSMKISSESDELIHNLGEIVWTVNPANDSLENIFAYLRNYLSKTFEDNPGIILNLDFTEPEFIPKDLLINPDIKRNILLIVKESITNIFKHSGATEVTVLLNVHESGNLSGLKLWISDNGIGINGTKNNGTGNGIRNIQKRAESINANIQVTTTSPGGTHIRLYIPFKKTVNKAISNK